MQLHGTNSVVREFDPGTFGTLGYCIAYASTQGTNHDGYRKCGTQARVFS